MKTKSLKITGFLVLITLLLSACASHPIHKTILNNSRQSDALSKVIAQVDEIVERATQKTDQPVLQPTAVPLVSDASSLLAAYEGVLENVYTQVNPSVVNIRVVQKQDGITIDQDLFPFSLPQGSNPQSPQYSEGLGSGFVWDTQGHIVTNNHVVDGADKIEVTFADGTILPATLVGADSYSDLAVIKVKGAADLFHPIQLADSTQVKVGELAIAIGNPFGLEGTMTVGIVSALGRTLPASDGSASGPVYSIPNIIQTDAPINPGNSGGVLVNDQGQVIGVTAAIESLVGTNAGVGFAIPSAIVDKVVPALIKTGKYEHPYLGISGGNLTPDMAAAMDLQSDQRGILVATVVEGGPAFKAGLHPSQDTITVDGQEILVGGDVIVAIDDQHLTKMDDLIAYLNDETEVGQTVKLTILRDGKEIILDVSLTTRPSPTSTPEVVEVSPDKDLPDEDLPKSETRPTAWLGILGAQITPEIARTMGLDGDQEGVLIVRVESGSPADKAQLQGSDQVAIINGQTVVIGGDVIIALDEKVITSLDELRSRIRTYQPDAEVKLTILRDGESLEVPVVLAERPSFTP